MNARDVQRALRKVANFEKAQTHARFFKTKKGEYGEGDKFLGIIVPVQRTIARQFADLPLSEIAKLLKSPVHEDRFTALEILKMKPISKAIAAFYLKHTKYINNWDLVDTSAPYILGPVVDRKILYKLATSKNLWERRIAIVTTQYFIRRGDFADTLKIAEILLHDSQDPVKLRHGASLIHKATGWMLREVGNRDVKVLEQFLATHAPRMHRTMLRYAIEKFPQEKRKKYLTNSWQ